MAGILKELVRLTHEQIYEENKDLFISLGKGGHYTESQKQYAFELINNDKLEVKYNGKKAKSN